MESVETEVVSNRGNIPFVIRNAHICGLLFNGMYLEDVSVEQLEDDLMKTINKGFDEYNERVLKGLRNTTPDMEEIKEEAEIPVMVSVCVGRVIVKSLIKCHSWGRF